MLKHIIRVQSICVCICEGKHYVTLNSSCGLLLHFPHLLIGLFYRSSRPQKEGKNSVVSSDLPNGTEKVDKNCFV